LPEEEFYVSLSLFDIFLQQSKIQAKKSSCRLGRTTAYTKASINPI